MIRIKKLTIYLIYILPFIQISCQEAIDNPEVTSRKTILTDGNEKSWVITDLTEEGVGKLSDYFEDCDLDDKFIFNISGKLTYDFGSDNCSNAIEPPESSEWTLYEGDTKIRLGIEPYNLINLDKATLIISPTSNPSILLTLTSK